jgi:PAS domain S-box-containing protein
VFKDITARKRTQEALNQSEELYRRLIEESFDGIFVQKGTRIIFANSRLHEMLGYEHGDLVGRDHWTVYHPGYQHLTRKRAQARMRGEDVPSQYEVRLQKTDGSSFEGEINAKALLVEGEPGIQVWIRDISQRKRAQEALKESEQRYRQLTQSSLTGIYIHQDGEFVYVNERLGEIMGYRAEELLGRKYWEFVHPEDVEWVRAIGRDRGLGKSAPSQYEFRVVCKNGETKWLDAFITSISHLGRVATMGNVADSTDRKRVEAALKESENTYRTIFETTGTATVIINADTTISLANTEYQKLTGYSKEEIDGKLKWTETVLPEDLLWMKKQHELRRSDPAAAPKHYEFRLKDKEGKIKNVFLNVAMIPGTRQSVASLLDITDLKRAEQALLEREEQYRSVYETALVGLFRTRISDGKVLKANHKASQILGYATADELIPDEVVVSEFYPPERRAEFLRELQEYGEVSDFEVHLTLPSGRDVDIAVSAKIYPERGYVEGAFVDTTGRKEAEEELRRSEQKYRQILETIADGYHEVDLQGNMTLVNDSLCDMIGYSREEFLHINYRALMDEENARQAFQLYNQVYRSGNPDRGLCLEVIRKDGAKRIVSGSISLVKDADGKPAGFRGILRDITQQKHLEEQLRHAARMEAVGHLAGGIAHDFNNLLTAMMGYTNILIQQLPEGAAYQEKLAQIHRASERAVRLTQQLLAFSRKQVLDMRVIDLNAVITDLEKMLRRLIGENIEIVTHLNTAICNVHADLGQVEQILMNLAVNARDAMPHGGILRIETANVVLDEEYAQSHPEVTPGDYVMMAVSDTGRGMDSQVLARIFDPFFTTKEKGVGTGLGLSTVYGIVKQHKGHISAYSEPDLGSTFKVYLPCAHEAIDHPMKKSSTQSIPRGNESVLVVEDEEIVRNLTCEALEMLGYSTLAASDPEEAIALCDMHEGPIELLLTDVVLPRMDGKTLFERLVRTRPHLKVLYVSGYTENFIVHHGVLERTVQFLQKPFTIEGLARKVREVLDEISEGSEEEPSS